MSISRDPMKIYRDSVLVKQQQMLNKVDHQYDDYVTQIRKQQKEIKKEIKLLFYKEIDRIDNAGNYRNKNIDSGITNNHLYSPKSPKTIKMDIYDLYSTDDSENIPILGSNHCKQKSPNTNIDTTYITQCTQASSKCHSLNPSEIDQNRYIDTIASSLSIPPLPPLPPILPPLPTDIIPQKGHNPSTFLNALLSPSDMIPSTELSSILALMAANHKLKPIPNGVNGLDLNTLNPIRDITPSTLSLTPIPQLPPLIPPLPHISTFMKIDKNDTLITMKHDKTDIKCNKIPYIKHHIPDLPPLSTLLMKTENKKNILSEFDDKTLQNETEILLEDMPLIERVCIDEASAIIHKTSDCRKWKCDFCRKWIEYTSDRDVLKHLLEHRRERKFKCDYCPKVFKRKSDVKRHSRTHTGERPHKCSLCGKGFGTKYCLKTHIRTHTGDKPYECHFCGKSFRQNSHLTVHWRTHTGDKPYECKTCNKRFSQHSTLAVHYRIHNGNKPFVCPCCERPFTQRHSLQRHIRNVHKEYFDEHGVKNIDNLHNVQKAKEKALQNNMAKADQLVKDLLDKKL